MEELRHIHLGKEPAPRKSVIAELRRAFEAVVARNREKAAIGGA
jgi:hypothetical protein